jgi:hypothetical protein
LDKEATKRDLERIPCFLLQIHHLENVKYMIARCVSRQGLS